MGIDKGKFFIIVRAWNDNETDLCDMILNPKPGQLVKLHYQCRAMPHQGRNGWVVIASRGRGPFNVLVRLISGEIVVVPRGNLLEPRKKI